MNLDHLFLRNGAVWAVIGGFALFARAAHGAEPSCQACHPDTHSQWAGSVHAATQMDVARELGQSNSGLTPDEVVQAEDCIGCHAPTAVLTNGGMSEADALRYFFTTTNGQFSANTAVANAAAWPQVACIACHDVPTNHVTAPDRARPKLALFDSQTGQRIPVSSVSELCGQCHGNLHFPDTDHQLYNAWKTCKHANTQQSLAQELGRSDVGLTPEEVVSQVEDCVACHAPTAVKANGGMSSSEVLRYFFTTSNGQFTTNTAAVHTSEWPNVACNACHDQHNPGKPAYFNNETLDYQSFTNTTQLCGQCHGLLRFPTLNQVCDVSYNLVAGTGGVGVHDEQTMTGDNAPSCINCHMYRSDVDGSNSKNFGGHSWAVTVTEPGGGSTTSCTACHGAIDTLTANAIIGAWQSEVQSLEDAVQAALAAPLAELQGTSNTNWDNVLQEAQLNLSYASADASGGVHNHKYLMALLNDANQQALSIPLLNVMTQGTNIVVSWTGAGTLQSADAIIGPWQDVPNVTQPPLTLPAQGAHGQFYRLRQ